MKNDSTHIFPRHIFLNQFEEHIKYLKNNFEIISLEDAFQIKKSGIKSKKRRITISFDDGYSNNLINALPVLEKYEVKATFFISSVLLTNHNALMWSDVISFARYLSKGNCIQVDNIDFMKIGKYGLINMKNNEDIYSYIKKLSCAKRDVVIKDLIKKYDLNNRLIDYPEEWWRLLNKEELALLAKSKYVQIASHTHSHYNLANLSKSDALYQLQVSKEILSEAIKEEVQSVSFPDGSYNEEVKRMARNVGYRNLLAVDYRCDSDRGDLTILNRWGVSSTTTTETIILAIHKAFNKHGF